jgi:molecular chaperone HtpG
MSNTERHHFQAEIQQLLDIVIHSIYTDREVFVRELISNAADACEKLRFLQSSGGATVCDPDIAPAISIKTDDKAGTLTISDTGIGMDRGELVENLGTIAHSGTKAFLKQLAEKQKPDASLIGQFGVGFYSAFMVAKKVTVLSRSCREGEPGWRWISEGANGYEIEPAENLPRGTQVVLELKDDMKEFAGKDRIESIIKRYSNFVQFPIDLDAGRVNTVQAIWARNKNEVKEEEYKEFYNYIGHDSEAPLFKMHFTADAPLSIQALLFVPARNPEMPGFMRVEPHVGLYCRKVLIEPRSKDLLPEWLRFLQGVVDSEDLPLSLSRERMQDSDLMRKLNRAVTNKFLKFLDEQSEKDPVAFGKFHAEYSRYLKEGILGEWEHTTALGRLLRFDSSSTEKDGKTSLADYVKRMPSDQKEIYYLLAPNRDSAESSPSYEAFRARKWEVLFVYDPADEFVMDRLREFDGKSILSAEKANVSIPEPEQKSEQLSPEAARALAAWIQESLGTDVKEVRVSERLVDSPVIALEHDRMLTNTMRKTLRMINREGAALPPAELDLEINPRHTLIVQLEAMRHADAGLAAQVAAQLLDNARMSAGLLDDPRAMLKRLNGLLSQVLVAKK